MDNLRFARLISDITGISGRSLCDDEITKLAKTLNVELSETGRVTRADMLQMFEYMVSGRTVDAIKVYRAMTGSSLFDAKQDIERVTAQMIARP